jgi:hypothetical protein
MAMKDLINRLENESDSEAIGVLQNEILGEFDASNDLNDLRELLCSAKERLVRAGIWIASELGSSARPLLQTIKPLLRHPSKHVRFFAIDCLLTIATSNDGDAIALVVPMIIDDPESAVRWKAFDFFIRASRPQLIAALKQFSNREPSSDHTKSLQWLLSEQGTDPNEVRRVLKSEESIWRRYGVVAAARIMMLHKDMELVSAATESSDDEIRDFASSALKHYES